MTLDDLLTALLGPFGLVVGSLVLNVLFYRGMVLSRRVVARPEHDALLAINAAYAEQFAEQTKAIERLTVTVERVAAK